MKHQPTPEELAESDWAYDDAPEGISPYKLLGMLAIAGVTTTLCGYGYYAFVDDFEPHVTDLISGMLALLSAIALFTYAVRRDGFEWGFRWFTIGSLLLVPMVFSWLLFSGALRIANVWLDFSEEKAWVLPVAQKGSLNARRYNQVRPGTHLLFVREEDGQHIWVPVKRQVHDAATLGDNFEVATRTGALGREWIVRAVPTK